jgi:site-specific recombinase XerD
MDLSQELLEQLIRKVVSEKSDKTLIQFRDEYVEAIKYTHSKSYLRSVEYTFKDLLKFSDNLQLSRLDNRFMENYIISTFKRSKYTASLYFRTLKAAFSKAVDWDYISSNPFNKIKLPKFQKSNPAFISLDELDIILSHVDSKHLKDIYQFAFFTGMRLSELINLKWNNVNLTERIIQVGDEEFITKGKKIRMIPLCNQAFNILTGRVPKIIKTKNHFVFTKENNYPYTGNYVSKSFKKAVKKTELNKSIHMHTLRHSAASTLLKNGASIYSIKEILGHSSIKTTEIYSHITMDSLKIDIAKFNHLSGGVS